MYSDACARVGYDHSARPAVSLDQINSPVTRRAFGEAIKQIRAVAREFGPIDCVHIELARDVGKSAEERAKLTKGIDDRNADKDRKRKQASELLGREVSDDELMRFELATNSIPVRLLRRPDCAGRVQRQRYALSGRPHPAVVAVRRRFVSQQDAVLRALQPGETRTHALRMVQSRQERSAMGGLRRSL